MKNGAIRVGKALIDFEGVLTGVPKYHGKLERLEDASEKTAKSARRRA
jgi:hypothetical protein